MASPEEGLGALAKRWFRAKTTELLTGNRSTRESASAEASTAQQEVADRAVGHAVEEAFPGLRRARERQEAAAAERAATERAGILALPRGEVSIAVSGVLSGEWRGPLPVRLDRDEQWLTVEVVLTDDLVPAFGDTDLRAVALGVPSYHGPGRYDLQALARQAEAAGEEYDPTSWQVSLGNVDEPYYWVPGGGAGVIEVGPQEGWLQAQLAMQGAAGDVDVTLHLTLPPPPG